MRRPLRPCILGPTGAVGGCFPIRAASSPRPTPHARRNRKAITRGNAFLRPQSASGTEVRALYQAPDGTPWIGTYGGGLTRYAGGAFVRYTTANGLYTAAR